MCVTAKYIQEIRDMHVFTPQTIANWEVSELHTHLAVEVEKRLQVHRQGCLCCLEEMERKTA